MSDNELPEGQSFEVDEIAADINAGLVVKDLPDLVPHSGESFGKPTLKGD